MGVSVEQIREAVETLSSVEGVFMPASSLAEDAFLLSIAFPDEDDYLAACASTIRALERLVKDSVSTSELKYDLEGWHSFHYQHRVGQGMRATMRIVYRKTGFGIEVLGFGHREVPLDVYRRLSRDRS